MPDVDSFNEHKKWTDEKLTIENVLDQFMDHFHKTGYTTLQRYQASPDMVTLRKIKDVIVVGNVTCIEGLEDSGPLDNTDCTVCNFDRIWVFTDENKLKNYLKLVLESWYHLDWSAGNVEDLANFCKDIWFWDNTYFTRTGYKGSLSWSDMMDETLFSIRKPKEQMEKLTGDKIDEWFRAEND